VIGAPLYNYKIENNTRPPVLVEQFKG
jgi:hypothetical protein